MIGDYFSLAFENVKHRGLRSWLTMLGIFIGIAAVVSLISLGDGLRTAITGQFDALSVDRLTVQNSGTGFGPPGSTAIRKLTSHDVDIVESAPGAEQVIDRLIRIVTFEFEDQKSYNYIASLPPDKKKADYIYKTMNVGLSEGSYLYASDRGKVLLGSDFKTDPYYGDKMRVGSKVVVQGKTFQVKGILNPASTFQINSVIVMNEDEMKDLLKIGDETDIIVLQVASRDEVEKVADDISRRLRKDRGEKVGEEDFTVDTPASSLKSVNLILNIINVIVAGIAAISLLVGGIGIANSMFTSVLERTKEIGVMKAVGAKNRDILMIFLVEAGLMGLVGGLLGAFFGLGMAFGLSSIANALTGTVLLKVAVSYPLMIAAISFSFFLGMACGVIPALQASRLKPVEALRT